MFRASQVVRPIIDEGNSSPNRLSRGETDTRINIARKAELTELRGCGKVAEFLLADRHASKQRGPQMPMRVDESGQDKVRVGPEDFDAGRRDVRPDVDNDSVHDVSHVG